MTERRTYTVAEVSAMTGVPRSTVMGWIGTGVLRHYRVLTVRGHTSRVLVPADALDELLERSRAGAWR